MEKRDTIQRVLFPLWLKLGLVFSALSSAIVVLAGWTDFQDDLAHRTELRRERLLRLAESHARVLDADVVTSFARSADMERSEYQQLYQKMIWIQVTDDLRWAGILGRKGNRYFYVMDGEPEDPLPFNYPLFDSWPALQRAFEGQPGYASGLEDEWGRWDSAFAPILDVQDNVVAVLGLDLDADWQDEIIKRKARRVMINICISILLTFAVAMAFTRILSRHLQALAKAARQIALGHLDIKLGFKTRDEVGALAASFRQMVAGLRERDFIRDTFGRYMSPAVAQKVLSDPGARHPGGELRTITVLMSDLRGFTSLSEQHTPGETVEMLNAYLGQMSGVIQRHEGTILEFIGDAIMVIFGAPFVHHDDPLRAVNCAVEMQIALEKFNTEHAHRRFQSLQMGIGISTGQAIVGNIGSQKRMKYGVVGDVVNCAARVESFTVGGEVLVTQTTHDALGEGATFRGPFEVFAKGKNEALKLYAVVAVGDLRMPVENQVTTTLIECALSAECFKITGKQQARDPISATLVKLGTDEGELEIGQALGAFDDVMLKIQMALHDDSKFTAYAKVHSCQRGGEHFRCRFKFTHLDERGREFVAAHHQKVTGSSKD